MSAPALQGSPADQATFRSLMVRIMTYVMSKLSGKGVFHNTLLFAGRTLGRSTSDCLVPLTDPPRPQPLPSSVLTASPNNFWLLCP